MNDTAFVFLKIIISMCAALLTVWIIPYIQTLKENMKFSKFLEMIDLMVKAAEQTIRESGKGRIKKDKVTEFLEEYLNSHNIHISRAQLSELIESAVYSMKQAQVTAIEKQKDQSEEDDRR